MARKKMEKLDIYLLAAIAVLSLLLVAVELVPIPMATVIEDDALVAPVVFRTGARAIVRIPPTPATTMATVNVAV